MLAGSGNFDPEKIQTYLEKVEEQAENILANQAEIVELDKRRNLNREALRHLQGQGKYQKSFHSWTCLGNMFIRLPRTNLIDNINKG